MLILYDDILTNAIKNMDAYLHLRDDLFLLYLFQYHHILSLMQRVMITNYV
jgi:hypothetical protein